MRQNLPVATTLCSLTILGLTACSTGGGSRLGGWSGETPVTMNSLPPGQQLQITRGQGLETATVAAGPTLQIDETETDAELAKTEEGFILLLPDGRTAAILNDQMGENEDPTAPDGASEATSEVSAGTDRIHIAMHGESYGLRYSEFGGWDISTAEDDVTSVAAWATGIATAGTDMPASGTASYTGGAQGYATVGGVTSTFSGAASLTADFSGGNIQGEITDIRTATVGSAAIDGGMNDIDLVGVMTAGDITGEAAAAANSGEGLDISGATGSFGGKFFGPQAAEVAGSFSLSGGSQNVELIGSFGAGR